MRIVKNIMVEHNISGKTIEGVGVIILNPTSDLVPFLIG